MDGTDRLIRSSPYAPRSAHVRNSARHLFTSLTAQWPGGASARDGTCPSRLQTTGTGQAPIDAPTSSRQLSRAARPRCTCPIDLRSAPPRPVRADVAVFLARDGTLISLGFGQPIIGSVVRRRDPLALRRIACTSQRSGSGGAGGVFRSGAARPGG